MNCITERETLTQARLGQGQFRKRLCNIWDNSCAVTGVTIPELLRASHIKPWKESNNTERLDENNGLLLIANIDAAFDKYLLSFRDDGSMIFSDILGDDPYKLLGIPCNSSIKKEMNYNQKRYIQIHREKLKRLTTMQ